MLKRVLVALTGLALLATPTMASASETPTTDGEKICQFTAEQPYEKQMVGGQVAVRAKLSWSCYPEPEFGEVYAYLQRRDAGKPSWQQVHELTKSPIGRFGSLDLGYMPCVKGYHRIWYRYNARIKFYKESGSGESKTIYLDCRP